LNPDPRPDQELMVSLDPAVSHIPPVP
jgi:hypothetical protein